MMILMNVIAESKNLMIMPMLLSKKQMMLGNSIDQNREKSQSYMCSYICNLRP